MNVNKKKFKIIVILIIILLIIPLVVILREVIYFKVLAKDTENKISQIDVEELENKIIEELENSEFNVDNSSFITKFSVCEEDILDYEGWIIAGIIENTTYNQELLVIPLCKIEGSSENSQKVSSIKYIYSNDFDFDIANIIHNILREQYDISSSYNLDRIKYWGDKYSKFPFKNSQTNSKAEKIDMLYSDDDFAIKALSVIFSADEEDVERYLQYFTEIQVGIYSIL